jgi:hypothetical protein
MSLPLAFAGVACAGVAAICFARYRVHDKMARDPAKWPAGGSPPALKRYVRRYLRSTGWTLLPPWGWCDVQVRASKGQQVLNLLIPHNRQIRLQSLVKDAGEVARRQGAIVTLFTHGFSEHEIDQVECRSGVLIAGARDLPGMQSLLDPDRRLPAIPECGAEPAMGPAHGASPIKGFARVVNATRVRGWAYAADAPDEHLRIDITVDENAWATVRADRFRQDLADAGIGKGDHGFDCDLGDSATKLYSGMISVTAVTAGGHHGSIKLLDAGLPPHVHKPSEAAGALLVNVINLDREPERFNSISAGLAAVPGLHVKRISAIYGPDLPDAAALLLGGHPSVLRSLGTLGTFLSHIKAWEAVIQSGEEVAVILEDDAVLLGFERILSLEIPPDAELIFINDRMSPGSRHAPPAGPILCLPIVESLRVLNGSGRGVGGDGYILTRAAAHRLLEQIARDRCFGHVDWRLLRYGTSEDDVSGEMAGTRVGEIVANHHNSTIPPAWAIIKAYCVDRPLVAFATGSTSTRERANAAR